MLNNKGITTVEVLICFVLVTIIASSLYSTVAMFNEKRIEAMSFIENVLN